MDSSLDEAIAKRRRSQYRDGDGKLPPRGNSYLADGVRKSARDDSANLANDWVHDRFDDGDRDAGYRDARPSSYRNRARVRPRRDDIDEGRYSEAEGPSSTAKLRVKNLHYDITEDELKDLFERIAPVESVELMYDRAGRSHGTAIVVYAFIADARKAIREYDGANAKGQPIRLELLPPSAPAGGRGGPTRRRGNLFDRVENPRSLFDRVEAPSGRGYRARSASPDEDRGHRARSASRDEDRGHRARSASPDGDRGYRARRGGRDPTSRDRRSNMSKPAPDGIDRYVPGRDQGRSLSRRRYGGREGGGGGRRPGERRERGGDRGGDRSGREGRDAEGRRLVNGRPRKTQEELDAEMEDYWGNAGTAAAADRAATNGAASAPDANPVPQITLAADEDVDMIE